MRENDIKIAGRIVTDWRIKEIATKTGKKRIIIENALVVDNGYYKGATEKEKGEWVEKPVFIAIKYNTWDFIPHYLINDKAHKGAEVYISGKIDQDKWEKDGKKMERTFIDIIAIQKIKDGKNYVPSEKKYDNQKTYSSPAPKQETTNSFEESSDEIPF
jgi:single-stranded DNA-binding protein